MGILIWAHENDAIEYVNKKQTFHYKPNYTNKYAVHNVIKDITRTRGDEQYYNQLISYGAIGCGTIISADVLIKEFLCIQNIHNIERKKGRRIYHEVFSLRDEEVAGLYYNMNFLYSVAMECANWYFEQGHQVVFAIHHQSRFHIHFAVNTINFRTGLKFHTSKTEKEAREKLFNLILYKYLEIAKIPVSPITFCHDYVPNL